MNGISVQTMSAGSWTAQALTHLSHLTYDELTSPPKDEDIMPLAPNDDLVEPCTAQVVEGADAGGLENPSEESPDPVGVAEDFREVEVEDASGAGEGEQGEAGDAKDGEVEPEEEQHAEKEEENEEMKEKEEHDAENQEREETDEKENEENEEKEKDEEIPEVERAHFEMAELHGVSDDEVPEEEVPPVAVEASLDEVEDPHEMDAEERSQSEIEAAGGVISAAEAPKDASDPPVAEVCEEAVRQEAWGQGFSSSYSSMWIWEKTPLTIAVHTTVTQPQLNCEPKVVARLRLCASKG